MVKGLMHQSRIWALQRSSLNLSSTHQTDGNFDSYNNDHPIMLTPFLQLRYCMRRWRIHHLHSPGMAK